MVTLDLRGLAQALHEHYRPPTNLIVFNDVWDELVYGVRGVTRTLTSNAATYTINNGSPSGSSKSRAHRRNERRREANKVARRRRANILARRQRRTARS